MWASQNSMFFIHVPHKLQLYIYDMVIINSNGPCATFYLHSWPTQTFKHPTFSGQIWSTFTPLTWCTCRLWRAEGNGHCLPLRPLTCCYTATESCLSSRLALMPDRRLAARLSLNNVCSHSLTWQKNFFLNLPRKSASSQNCWLATGAGDPLHCSSLLCSIPQRI